MSPDRAGEWDGGPCVYYYYGETYKLYHTRPGSGGWHEVPGSGTAKRSMVSNGIWVYESWSSGRRARRVFWRQSCKSYFGVNPTSVSYSGS